MPLTHNAAIGFIPTRRSETVRPFFEDVLGLTLVEDNGFAFVFRAGTAGSTLRVTRTPDFAPQPFTIFGWESDDLETTVDELTAKGVDFLRVDFIPQDARGIWRAPNGDAVAWFKDPDGNTLSVSQHV